MNVNDIYTVLIAVGIILGLVVICVIFALYLMKNKIYSSSDEHFGKLAPNEKAYDLKNEKDKKEIKEILNDDFSDEEKDRLSNYGYRHEELSKLRFQARDKYLKSKKTIKISEIAKAFNNKYPQMSDINVKYAIMKLVTLSETKENKPIVLKKVGKTFHIKIKDLLAMRHCIRYIPRNLDIKYNIVVINDIFDIALALLTKKIVPKEDKYL